MPDSTPHKRMLDKIKPHARKIDGTLSVNGFKPKGAWPEWCGVCITHPLSLPVEVFAAYFNPDNRFRNIMSNALSKDPSLVAKGFMPLKYDTDEV